MSARYHRYFTDATGVLYLYVTVEVLQPHSEILVAEAFYQDEAMTLAMPNPITLSPGILDFYMAMPQRVRLKVTPLNVDSFYEEDVEVLPDPVQMVRSSAGLSITNAPASGQILTATGTYTAVWQ